MKNVIEVEPKGDVLKTEENEKIIDVVEKIFKLNKKIKSRQGLKKFTPNQMFSRLPTSLAQLKAGNNSENLKAKLGNFCALCTDQKKLQNDSTKVWSTLFKDGNIFYGQRK